MRACLASVAPARPPAGRAPWRARGAAAAAALPVGAISAMRGREPEEAALAWCFGAVFLALAWSDLRRRVIPNRLVYPALALALAASGLWPDRGFLEAIAGGLVACAAALAVRALSRGGLGGGDVKMAALAGAVVGFPGVLAAGLWTAAAGGAAAATLLMTRRARWGARVPYGPFIALGAVVALLG